MKGPSFSSLARFVIGCLLTKHFVIGYLLTKRKCAVTLRTLRTYLRQMSNFDHVFGDVSNANLELNLKKCSFFKKQVEFLGHLIGSDGISPDPRKVSPVQNFPRPASVHDMRRFVGLASYFRKFIPALSTVAKHLLRLTEDELGLCGTSRVSWLSVN